MYRAKLDEIRLFKHSRLWSCSLFMRAKSRKSFLATQQLPEDCRPFGAILFCVQNRVVRSLSSPGLRKSNERGPVIHDTNVRRIKNSNLSFLQFRYRTERCLPSLPQRQLYSLLKYTVSLPHNFVQTMQAQFHPESRKPSSETIPAHSSTLRTWL